MPPSRDRKGFRSARPDDTIDARPDDGDDQARKSGPRSITDTQAWKSSSTGVKRVWFNYRKFLRDSFVQMSRTDQEDVITKISMVVTLGVTVLMIVIFYGVIPPFIRLLGVPAALVAAWWLGNNLVANVMIARMEHLLNKE